MTDRLDRDAVERVVQRAVELDHGAALDGDGLDADAVVAAAVEVGISADSVRTSLALERLGPGQAKSQLDRLVGPRAVVAERTVAFGAEEAFERLDQWLTNGHHLRREQRRGLSGEWHKRGDLVAGVQRKIRSVSGGAALGSVRLVLAQVSEIDEASSIIRIVVDRSGGRAVSLTVAGGVGAASLTGAAIAATAVPPLVLFAIPGLVVAGAAAARSNRTALRLTRELALVLDQLDAGDRPTMIGRGVARRLRR